MAHWPTDLLVDDFQEKLIRYMSAPISGTYGISTGTGSTGTATSPGIVYIPTGKTITSNWSVS